MFARLYLMKALQQVSKLAMKQLDSVQPWLHCGLNDFKKYLCFLFFRYFKTVLSSWMLVTWRRCEHLDSLCSFVASLFEHLWRHCQGDLFGIATANHIIWRKSSTHRQGLWLYRIVLYPVKKLERGADNKFMWNSFTVIRIGVLKLLVLCLCAE